MEKKVFICSPYAPTASDPTKRKDELEWNTEVAQAASLYALMEGNVPYAPHLYFTQFLDDADGGCRELGRLLGLRWLKECDEVWVIGRRISKGMEKEIRVAKRNGIPVRHFVFKRTTDERILDAIRYPDTVFHEMDFSEM